MASRMSGVRSVEALRELVHGGEQPEFLFFYGHTPPHGGIVNATCLSQWWQVDFIADNERYRTAEHFMMASKAKLFGDYETAEKIMLDPDPRSAKLLGRQVAGFDKEKWENHRFDIVVDGNLAKFGQHSTLTAYLLGSDDQVLVEAARNDRIWGIGMDREDKHATNPGRWPGLNLLGFALMEVRDQLRT